MVEGLTEDVDLVVDGDDNDDNDHPHKPGDTGPVGSPMPDRHEYKINRAGGDPLGEPESITYGDGNQVKFDRDENGNLIQVSDTASGVTFTKSGDGWIIAGKDGTQTFVKGEMSVNSEDGSIVLKMENGTTITTYADGRSTITDEKGDLVGMGNPGNRVGTNSTYLSSPTGGTAAYDNDHNLIRAEDLWGNRFERTPDGGWVKYGMDGTIQPVDGAVTFNPYTGVTITPSNNHNIHPGH
jgi:YD repeat-containing protein